MEIVSFELMKYAYRNQNRCIYSHAQQVDHRFERAIRLVKSI